MQMQGVLVAGRLRATPRTLIVCPAGFSMSADMRTNPDCEKELAQPVRPCKHPPRPKDHLLKRLWLAAQKRRLPRGLACNPHVKLEQGIDDFLSLRSRTGQQNPEPGEALPLCCSLAPQVAGALGKAHSPSQPAWRHGASSLPRQAAQRGQRASAAGARAARAVPRSGPHAQRSLSTHRLCAVRDAMRSLPYT